MRRILTKVRESVNVTFAAAGVLIGMLVLRPGSADAIETIDVVAVRAEFVDRPLAVPLEAYVDEPDGLLRRFERYWDEVSHGRGAVRVRLVERVVRLTRPRASYVQQPHALAIQALDIVRGEGSESDRAVLAAADQAIVFFAGAGRESHVGKPPNDPWSNYVPLGRGFGRIRGASVIAESEVKPFSNFGVLCHEFGHQLGLPELYAPGGAKHEGIGVWGLMGQGTWLDRGRRPPDPSAWSKLQLGWVDVDVVTTTRRGVRLAPIRHDPRVVKIVLPDAPAEEYLLVEHRTRDGADEGLPGEGLLVWHVDERRRSFRNAQADVGHKMLHLVEADGRDDLDRGHAAGGNRGDASDPWRPVASWRRHLGAGMAVLGALAIGAAIFRLGCGFSPVAVVLRIGLGAGLLWGAGRFVAAPVCGPSHPGMRPYDGGPGRVAIRSLRRTGEAITFDVLVLPVAAPARPDAGTPAG